ncbi:MAG TPA: endo-1,4-beta-xylanase [Puia sp.]|jgi:endo-1,4-beta-xylanase|nr:endo-1,4-beta-xylanase [Puia sp.]
MGLLLLDRTGASGPAITPSKGMKKKAFAIVLCFSFFSCLAQPDTTNRGLKDYYSKYFPVGVSVAPLDLKNPGEVALILQQFNSLTPENCMKMGPIHPKENEYYWKDADSIIAFALRNHLKIRGHNLCWHQQTPNWFFTGADGMMVTKKVLLQRLEDHITTVVKRYKGKIYGWDVVNEAISDKPDEYLRNSLLYKICGEEYIAKAFMFAHTADPDAVLFYNDYNEINPLKRKKIIRLLTNLIHAGVPVHAIGLQGHWAMDEPSALALDSTLADFSTLGLQIQITELDISVYPKEHISRDRKPADTLTAYTPEKEAKQTLAYRNCFTLFKKYNKYITGVTFWNVSDKSSWLDNFPVRGRKDYPLLFDIDLKPKKAYWAIVEER